MVAYIRDMAVNKQGWLSQESFKQGVGICQSIPGATAIQAAAYVGLRAGGVWGAIAAYLGFGMPAFVLMTVLSALYLRNRELAMVASIFAGLQVVVAAMVAHAAYSFGRSIVRNWRDLGLGLAVAGFLFFGGNPLVAIGVAALLGPALVGQTIKADEEHRPAGKPLAARDLRPALLLTLALLAALALLFAVDRNLFALALMMVKIDCFAFGGGYASVPLMFNEVVSVKQWMTSQTFMDGIALGQTTPGPIVVTATFIGFLRAGLTGAIVATTAIFAPSLIMLIAAVPTFDRIQHKPLFQQAMHGALVSFTGLLLSVALRFTLAIPWEPCRIILALLAVVALWRKVDLLWVILAGIAISAALL
jgi:chromate transporter